MKPVKYLLALVVFTLFLGVSHAQKMTIEVGDFKFLKGQELVNLEFEYDKLRVHTENWTSEEYMERHAKRLNKKKAGSGDIWKEKWITDREDLWEYKFIKYMNQSKRIAFRKEKPEAKYTLIVDVIWVYPGWNSPVMSQSAKLSTILTFVETANPDNVLLKITSRNAPGDVAFSGTYDDGIRISEGFTRTAKVLLKKLSKKIKVRYAPLP